MANARQKLMHLLGGALDDGSFVKLTLAAYRGRDRAMKQVQVRPVDLREGPRLSFVWRYATRDVTKNFSRDEAVALLEDILETDFRSAHLFTTSLSAQLEFRDGREPRFIEGPPAHATPPSTAHDKPKQHPIDRESGWLQALGVFTADGKVVNGMESKFRQMNKFVEVLEPLLADAGFNRASSPQPSPPLQVEERGPEARERILSESMDKWNGDNHPLDLVDMGCGKGYLTFAACDWLRNHGWPQATVRGIEARPELVELCNRAAREHGFERLTFESGGIASATLDHVDVVIALHACDTATDDAIAKGVQADARLILVSPCCHKELRAQLRPPPVLADALRHGIVLERHAEFLTDALRAALLEWAGYEPKVFEFISTEHTAKNLMIAAVKRKGIGHVDAAASTVRELAGFYGVRSQRLAALLGFSLEKSVNA